MFFYGLAGLFRFSPGNEFFKAFFSQQTGRAFSAAESPCIQFVMLTNVTGVRFIDDKIDKSLSSQFSGELPRFLFYFSTSAV